MKQVYDLQKVGKAYLMEMTKQGYQYRVLRSLPLTLF